MLSNKEKNVLIYLIASCKKNGVSLIKAENILKNISKNHIVSLANLDEIMISLNKDDYIDYVNSSSRTGQCYCITLKNKALTYKSDIKKAKKANIILIGKTVALAILSFVIGVVLKTIFTK